MTVQQIFIVVGLAPELEFRLPDMNPAADGQGLEHGGFPRAVLSAEQRNPLVKPQCFRAV